MIPVVAVLVVVAAVAVAAAVVVAEAVVVLISSEKRFVFYPAISGVILKLGALPEPWEFKNTLENLSRF